MNDDWFDSDRQRNITVLTGSDIPFNEKASKHGIILGIIVSVIYIFAPVIVYGIGFLNLLLFK